MLDAKMSEYRYSLRDTLGDSLDIQFLPATEIKFEKMMPNVDLWVLRCNSYEVVIKEGFLWAGSP